MVKAVQRRAQAVVNNVLGRSVYEFAVNQRRRPVRDGVAGITAYWSVMVTSSLQKRSRQTASYRQPWLPRQPRRLPVIHITPRWPWASRDHLQSLPARCSTGCSRLPWRAMAASCDARPSGTNPHTCHRHPGVQLGKKVRVRLHAGKLFHSMHTAPGTPPTKVPLGLGARPPARRCARH